MAGIPKNVMQIGQTDTHVKIYMETMSIRFWSGAGTASVWHSAGKKKRTGFPII